MQENARRDGIRLVLPNITTVIDSDGLNYGEDDRFPSRVTASLSSSDTACDGIGDKHGKGAAARRSRAGAKPGRSVFRLILRTAAHIFASRKAFAACFGCMLVAAVPSRAAITSSPVVERHRHLVLLGHSEAAFVQTDVALWQSNIRGQEFAWQEALERINRDLPPDIAPPTAFSDLVSGRRTAAAPDDMLTFGDKAIPRWLVDTVVQAAEVTNTDPVYLMALADKESGFDYRVRARASSASGMFQFLSGTWLEMIRTYGPQYDLGAEASAIEDHGGRLTVRSAKDYRRIMELRNNPYVAALMAAEMLKRDTARIEQSLGRELARSEFYLSHFLGASSASRLIQVNAQKPDSIAARLFPRAARANRPLFVKRDGRRARALSVSEFHRRIGTIMDDKMFKFAGVENIVMAKAGR